MQNTGFSLRNQFIDTKQARYTQSRIAQVVHDTQCARTSKGLLLCGPSGSGKTTLIREFLGTTFPVNHIPGTQKLAIRVEMPSSPSKKNLASAMLAALGDSFASSRSHSAEVKFTRIVVLLKNLGTKLVILDESQHLIDYNKRNSVYEAADWIKGLMNETEITVVLVGLKRTQRLLWANEQLRRRFSACIEYDRFMWNSPEAQEEFAQLVKSVQSVLPIQTIDFQNEDVLHRMHHACFGLLDYLIKVIDRAVWIVQSGQKEGIDLDVLAKAFVDEIWHRAPEERNPFSPEFNFKPLIGIREPFENIDEVSA